MSNNNQFISSEIEGIKQDSPRKTAVQTKTHTPQTEHYETPADAKPETIDQGSGRKFVPVRYDSLERGSCFSREIHPNKYIVHTKKEDKSNSNDFAADLIVWVFEGAI